MENSTNKSAKRNKIIYWIATVWLALGMTASGITQLLRVDEVVAATSTRLGYPVYVLTILGVWKILGVVVLFLPKLPVVKEWAYAGFFFVASGAIISHLAVNDPFSELFGPTLLIVLIIVSWYFRPVDRKPITVNQ